MISLPKCLVPLTCLSLAAACGCESSQYRTGVRADQRVQLVLPPQGRVLKHRIAVLPFRDQTGHPGLAEAATQVLVTELFKSKRFIVVERERLVEVLSEQELEGIVTPETLAQAGQVLGVELFFTGSVTGFDLREKSGGVSIPIPTPYVSLPSVRISKRKSHVEVSLDGRIIDTTSAKIVFAGTGESARDDERVGFGNTYETRVENFGRLVRFAVNDMMHALVARLDSQPWSGRVAHVGEQGFYLSGGREVNMRPGDRFQVIRRGAKIYNPSNGQLIGYEEQPLGSVEVVQVQEKLAIARTVEGGGFEIGDVIRSMLLARSDQTVRTGDVRSAADEEPQPAKRFCSNCGEKLAAGVKFCGTCGRKVGE